MAEKYSSQSNHPKLDFNETTASSQTLSNKAIFRRLIGEEIRNGRLSIYRRKRIVQYAAHLGISAVEMGEMIEKCSQVCFKEASQQNTPLNLHSRETSDHRPNSTIITCLVGLGFILIAMACIAFVD